MKLANDSARVQLYANNIENMADPNMTLTFSNSESQKRVADILFAYGNNIQQFEGCFEKAELISKVIFQFELPQFILNAKGELQMKKEVAGYSFRSIPCDYLAAKFSMKEAKEEAKSRELIELEKTKLAGIELDAFKMKSKLKRDKAITKLDHQFREGKEKLQIKNQKATLMQLLVNMKEVMYEEEITRNNAFEQEIAMRMAELQRQKFEYELMKERMQIEMDQKLASARRSVELAEAKARHQRAQKAIQANRK